MLIYIYLENDFVDTTNYVCYFYCCLSTLCTAVIKTLADIWEGVNIFLGHSEKSSYQENINKSSQHNNNRFLQYVPEIFTVQIENIDQHSSYRSKNSCCIYCPDMLKTNQRETKLFEFSRDTNSEELKDYMTLQWLYSSMTRHHFAMAM